MIRIDTARFVALALFGVSWLTAQTVDDTQLKQVILLGRHGVRTPALDNTALNAFSVLPAPVFPNVPPPPLGISVLTPNGGIDETILGGYFRLWLTQEGLLTGNDAADSNFIYFRADDAPLITQTAQAFATGMLPAVTAVIHSYTAPAIDPLFSPVGAGVAILNYPTAIAAVNGRLGGNAQSLSTAFAAELALTRAVLMNYPPGSTDPPVTPTSITDVTVIPISVTPGNVNVPVTLGGLTDIGGAIDPFIMQYTDGLALQDVGWGQLDVEGITQIFRLYTEILDLEYRTPYLAQVQSSNLASHIVRSMVQVATGNPSGGAIATPATKVISLVASNTNLTGLAGLFKMDWLMPSYEADVCAPSGVMVFELRQSQSTGQYIVRASYVTQTMDQLRYLTPLTLAAPPANAPVFIPGCSISNPTFDCPLEQFVGIAAQVIDPYAIDLVN